jgi:hypothetical protein
MEGERAEAREVALPEQCVRVEVAQVEREHFVEQLVGFGLRTRVDAVSSVEEEVYSRVVARGRDLRQPERRALLSDFDATRDVMRRIFTVQRERREPEHGCVDAHRRHVARDVRMPPERPLLLRLHGDDRSRDLVAHGRAERDLAGGAEKAATQAFDLHASTTSSTGLPTTMSSPSTLCGRDLRPVRRERPETEPRAVAPDERCAGARRRKHHVRETQLVRDVATPAGREEARTREPQVSDLRDRDGLADDVGVRRQEHFGVRVRFELEEGARVVGLGGGGVVMLSSAYTISIRLFAARAAEENG